MSLNLFQKQSGKRAALQNQAANRLGVKQQKKIQRERERKLQEKQRQQAESLLKKNKKLLEEQKREAAPKSAQDMIHYRRMYEDGICEVERGLFSKTIEFTDINYQTARRDEQVDIFSKYCDFLNYFDPSTNVQITINNRLIDQDDFKAKMLLETGRGLDNLDKYRKEYNNIISQKALEGQNSVLKDKYITFATNSNNYYDAVQDLAKIEGDVLNNFKDLDCDARVQTGTERVKYIHREFNPDDKFIFDYDYLLESDLTTKDYVAPDSFHFSEKSSYEFGDSYGQVLYLKDLPADLSDKFIMDITDIPCNLTVTIHFLGVEQDEAIALVEKKIAFMEQQKIDEVKKAKDGGYEEEMIPYELRYSLEDANELREDLRKRNQRMFKVTILVKTTAKSKEALGSNVYKIMAAARKNNCKMGYLNYLQREGMNSSLPLGKNHVDIKRTLTTASTAIFVPFTTQELFQEGGVYYGTNSMSKNLVYHDRTTLLNGNGFILGTPGCFPWDEKFVLADGTVINFKDAQKRFKDEPFKVKSYDIKTGKEVIAIARNSCVRKEAVILQHTDVATENEKTHEIISTEEHLFLMENGEYKKAKELEVGDRFKGSDLTVKSTSSDSRFIENPIELYDIEVEKYHNFMLEGGIFAHNSGKSFKAKEEISQKYLGTDDDIIIIDPEREYVPLAREFGGQVVKISASSKTHINLMDISMNYSDDEEPMVLKADFILTICEILVGGRVGLSSAQRSIIDRVITIVYNTYFSNPEKYNVPTLKDFYNVLILQSEEEAKGIALALEVYINGTLSVFSHPTDIEINKRLVVFDTKDLGKQLKTMGMMVVLDQIWNRITQNRILGKRTWIYIDEIYLLFQNEYSANFLFELFKRARKWGGFPTGITQNVEELLASLTARTMLSNSEFLLVLNQSKTDRDQIADLRGISKKQQKYITNAKSGSGLLFAGKSVIAFEDEFPKDTELYKLMTTKLDEVTENNLAV